MPSGREPLLERRTQAAIWREDEDWTTKYGAQISIPSGARPLPSLFAVTSAWILSARLPFPSDFPRRLYPYQNWRRESDKPGQ